MATRAELEEAADRAHAAIEEHIAAWGNDLETMNPGQRERRERLNAGFKRAVVALEDHDAREATIESLRQAAQDPANLENGFGGPSAPSGRSRVAPWAEGAGDDLLRLDTPSGLAARAVDAAEYVVGLPDSARALLVDVVEQDDDPRSSAFILGALDPAYRSAFEKWLRDPKHGHLGFDPREREAFARVRASMAVGTGSTGGFLLPFALDPTIIGTADTPVDIFRTLGTNVRTVSTTWNGVASQGVTAQWLGEGVAATDASPTFARLDIKVAKASAWITATYEMLADSNIATQIPRLIAEAKLRIEGDAFVSGSGSGAPRGLLTALSGSSSVVTSTTSGTFVLDDVYALVDALPTRARQGAAPAIMANYATFNKTRRFDTSGGAALWAQLADGTPPRLLGFNAVESSALTSTVTGSSQIAIAGDLRKFCVVDRLGVEVVAVDSVADTASGAPKGVAGFFAHWRVGSDVLDADCFRVLKIKA